MIRSRKASKWGTVPAKVKNAINREHEFERLRQRIQHLQSIGENASAELIKQRLDQKLKMHAKLKQKRPNA